MNARLDPRRLTRELLAFDTVNPPGMERACARHLGALLEGAGFRTEYHEYAEGRTSLIARIGSGDGKPICFTGHMDVVPLGAANETRPRLTAIMRFRARPPRVLQPL